MDLFKYAYQLYPFVSSELLRECLELAVKARKVDMRASPYDVSHVPDCSGKKRLNCRIGLLSELTATSRWKEFGIDLDMITSIIFSLLRCCALTRLHLTIHCV